MKQYRVLIINKYLYPKGGTESYVLRLGHYLSMQGHKVQYFGMQHEERCVGNGMNTYVKEKDYLNSQGIIRLSYAANSIYSLEAKKKIRLVLEDFKPNIIHVNNFNYQLTPSILVAIKEWEKETNNRCKIIYTAHDYQLICPNHMMYDVESDNCCNKCIGGNYINCLRCKCIHHSFAMSLIGTIEAYLWNKKKVYNNIDTIICCSEFMKIQLDKNPILKTKTEVLHNFVEYYQERNCHIEKKEYVLYFGRYSYEKGIHILVDVCKSLPDIQFVFAGSGELEYALKDIPNVKNVGFQTGEALERLICEAQFTVCPSKWYENCPFSVIESQMYGTPVVGSDIGGIPELIQNGVTGEIFESGNKLELRERIKRLWYDRKILEQYQKNCKKYRWNTIQDYYMKLMDIYQR